MASGRRGGPPDLKGTLGTLIRTTLYQMGALKDAVERQTRTQRGWFDGALLQRKRKDVLAALGELVYELVVTGELEGLEDFPEIGQAMADLDYIDRQIEQAEERSREQSFPTSTARHKPFNRSRDEVRVWRPVMPEDDDDESTVEDSATEGSDTPKPKTRRRTRRRAARGGGGIAFVDAAPDDDDLSEYMHADDVPQEEEDLE